LAKKTVTLKAQAQKDLDRINALKRKSGCAINNWTVS